MILLTSVGMIGGADGPTSVFVSDPNGILPILTNGAACVLALAIACIVWRIVKKKKK